MKSHQDALLDRVNELVARVAGQGHEAAPGEAVVEDGRQRLFRRRSLHVVPRPLPLHLIMCMTFIFPNVC